MCMVKHPSTQQQFASSFNFVFASNLQVVFTGSVGPNQDTVIALDDMLLTSDDCTPVLSVHCTFVNTTCLWTNDPQGLQWFSSDSYTDHTLNGPASSEIQGMDGSVLLQHVGRAVVGCGPHFTSLLSSLTCGFVPLCQDEEHTAHRGSEMLMN